MMIKTLKPLLSLLFIFQLSFAQEQVISGNITEMGQLFLPITVLIGQL